MVYIRPSANVSYLEMDQQIPYLVHVQLPNTLPTEPVLVGYDQVDFSRQFAPCPGPGTKSVIQIQEPAGIHGICIPTQIRVLDVGAMGPLSTARGSVLLCGVFKTS